VDKESMDSIIQQFRVSDIHEWLSNIRRGKATGPDGKHNEMISERKGPSGASKISTVLCNIFNTILRIKKLPSRWKEVHIIPAYKSSDDLYDVSRYRPISLLSNFGKIFTGMLAQRIAYAATQNYVLHPIQKGKDIRYKLMIAKACFEDAKSR
jgi:hypothetical protein